MTDQTAQDIKELQESLRAFREKSLAAFTQKQDSQFQKQDSQFEELKKLLILRNSRASPQSTADSEPSAQLSSSEVDSAAKIPPFDGSTEDEDHDEHDHPAPNSTFILEEDTESELPPSPPPTWKYDVFVSFRGKDTRRGFVSHLFQAFKSEDINCYRDVDGHERGQEVDSMLIEAIHHSKMAIILLSQNYADSKWCLQELVEILNWNERHRIHGHEVLPVFYNVSAYDVRHLGGMVGKAFGRCIARNGQYNKDIWANALKQAGRISSFSSNNGDEASIIKEIVEVLLKRVAYSRSLLLAKSSIVPNDNLNHLRSLLDTTSNDIVRTVGICGKEGVGKSTLANAACVHLHDVFEGRVILLDIDAMEDSLDPLEFQSKIVAKLIKDKWFRLTEDRMKNCFDILTRLSQKKVLIVLENVTTWDQVEVLLGKYHENCLCLGSRVVITSRDWELLDKHKVDDIYMVPPLNHEDSIKLFNHYAFLGQPEVDGIKRYKELSENIIYYAAGVPSILESLGHCLSNAPETAWHKKLGDLVTSTSPGDTELYQCGPFGGRGSVKISWDDGEHMAVRGIELVIFDSVIKSIGVTYDNFGHPIGPLFHGSSNSPSNVLPEKIELDYPNEYLTAISGYIGKTEATKFTTVRSLTFHSNRRTFGPFGDDSKTGQPFCSPPTGAKILGFFGAGDSQLQHIGVHAKNVSHTYPDLQVVRPFGRDTGNVWDHGATFTGIRKIVITLDNEDIVSISCVYDENGHPVERLSHHSQSTTYKQVEVTLNYPDEYILSMSGSYDEDRSPKCVMTLAFHTNLKTHGPYGYGISYRSFHTPLELSRIIGFFGTQKFRDTRLESIGAYLAPIYPMHPLMTIQPFGCGCSSTWDDGKHNGVKRIEIHHCDRIYYVRFTYVDGNGGTVQGRECGSSTSEHDEVGVKEAIELDYPNEYLVSIYGFVRNYKFMSLGFETNLKVLGPYGGMETSDKPFSFKSNIAKIVGFHGTFDEDHDFSIGPHLKLL